MRLERGRQSAGAEDVHQPINLGLGEIAFDNAILADDGVDAGSGHDLIVQQNGELTFETRRVFGFSFRSVGGRQMAEAIAALDIEMKTDRRCSGPVLGFRGAGQKLTGTGDVLN